MNALEAAIKIYKLGSNEDLNLKVLQILSLSEGLKSSEVLKNYEKIASGEIKVAFVRLKVEIHEQERNALEKKVKNKFGEGLVFDYEVSPEFRNNMEIRVGDDILVV